MSTELMSRFLEGLHESRLLDAARIEELLRRPEPPQGDMDGVAKFLEGSGWLTRYQIDEIRDGRGTALTFSGYRLLERLPDRPSGPAYRAFHPALQKDVVLRFINREWLDPADNAAAFIERARGASLLTHPHIQTTLDASSADDRTFVVQELIDGANLASLVGEMGALPVPLACEYIRQTALALQAGAERGICHGDLAPAHLLLSPVIRKAGENGNGHAATRPAPGATVKVAELGLIPARPPLGDIAADKTSHLGEYAFAAPERLTQPIRNVPADLWSLGASQYFLLGARPPFPATSPVDALQQLQTGEPIRIDKLRNDVPADLADFIHKLLSRDPSERPASAAVVAEFLSPYCQFGSAPVAKPVAAPGLPLASETATIPFAKAVPTAEPPMAETLPHVEPLPENTSDSQVFSPRGKAVRDELPLHDDHHHNAFADHHDDLHSRPLAKRPEVKGGHSWIILAILLHIIPITVAVLYFTETWPFGQPVASSTTQEEKPENKTPKKLNKGTKLP